MENENQTPQEKKTNLDYLKDSLFYLGFDDRANANLETAIKDGKTEITVGVSSLFDRPDSRKNDNMTKDYVTYELNFKKGSQSDNYFFNSYTANMVTKEGEERNQKFFIDKGRGITSKEAYNLLSGRAVYKTFVKKDCEKYTAFMQYDLNSPKDEKGNYPIQRYHEKFGYSVDKALESYPVKFDSPEQKAEIIKSLEKGNAQLVKLENGTKLFAAADPQNRDIKFVDSQNKNVQVEKIGVGEKKEVSTAKRNKIQ